MHGRHWVDLRRSARRNAAWEECHVDQQRRCTHEDHWIRKTNTVQYARHSTAQDTVTNQTDVVMVIARFVPRYRT
jgi:hypothetical protein